MKGQKQRGGIDTYTLAKGGDAGSGTTGPDRITGGSPG